MDLNRSGLVAQASQDQARVSLEDSPRFQLAGSSRHVWLAAPGVLKWLKWPGSVDLEKPMVSEQN